MSNPTASSAGQEGVPPDAVEKIRGANAAWHRRDLDAGLEPFAEDLEWDTTNIWTDGRVYRGMGECRAYFAELLARWDEQEMHLEEIHAVDGHPSVVVLYQMGGRSQSGIPIGAEWVHIFDFRDGEVARGRNFASFEAALKSLGDVRLSCLWSRAVT
jgi:ketosteroid isomerase-like protein